MAFVRHILLLLVLTVVTAATTGMPVLVHFCGGEPSEQVCPPDECCGEEDSATTEEDPCCTDEVTVASVDEDAQQAPSRPDLPEASETPLLPAFETADVPSAGSRTCTDACAGVHLPPDLAKLRVLRL